MVNINVYDYNQNTELNEIKKLLYQILDENKTLNEKINKYERYFKKFNKVFLENEKDKLTRDSEKSKININKTEKEKITIKKEESDDNLSELQKQILTILPIVNSNTELKEYTNKIRRTNHQKFTVKTLTEMFKKPRHRIVQALYKSTKTNKSLVDLKLINYFLLNPSKMKSPKVFYKIGDNFKDAENSIKPKNNKKSKSVKHTKGNNELYKNDSKITKVLFNKIKLNDDGTLNHYHKKTNREFNLHYNIQDIFYIKSLLKPDFTWKDFHNILSKNKSWNEINLKKIIYNIENNQSLNEILENLTNKISKCEFEKVGKFIKINNLLTKITPEQAKNWCNMYINSNKNKEEYIWNLQKRFPEIDAMCIRIILYNINNPELTETWTNEKKDINDIFIENNPTKRKNLIQTTGGII